MGFLRRKPLKAKTHVALGQCGLLLALLMLGLWLGLVPDDRAVAQRSRIALAEAVAANGSAFVSGEELRRLDETLTLIVERNEDLLSAAVRRSDRRVLARIGDHATLWDEKNAESLTDSHLIVPLFSGRQRWGQVEMRFEPIRPPGILGFLANPRVRLLGFIAIVGFFVFSFYLGRVLEQLDPSEAVPTHVRSALDTLAEGLLVLDLKGRVVLANQAFASLLGKSDEELLGKPASDLAWTDVEGQPIDARVLPWVLALEDGTPQRDDFVGLAGTDGEPRMFQANCSPVLGAGGKYGGVLVSLDDVTQLEEHKTQLKAAIVAAESANKSKSEFLANMSHEIRTPMNAILGFTDVLRRGFAKNPEERARHLATIHSSGKHLLQLINDVLDLSKVESGRLEIETLDFAPHVLIQEVASVLQVKADEKSIGLVFDVAGPIPETIASDPTRLRQIVTNLLSNAIKFTEEGEVRITARMVGEGAERRLVVDVKDDGIGIAEDKFDAVFEAFVQADTSVTRRFGGTGLGLPISRRFARLLGGDIVVSSVPGEGSTFSVTLDPGPLDGVRMISPEEALASSQQASLDTTQAWQFSSGRVLVVDDGDENRELAQLVLEEAGLEVDGAENGLVGVEKVRAGRFDVILMDMQMPVMDGYTAASTLRAEGVDTPIIALTADAMAGAEQRCIEAGCTGFLTKPIDIDELLATLAGILGGEQVARSAPVEETAPAEIQAAVAEPVVTAAAPAPLAPAAPAPTSSVGPPIVSRLATGNPRLQATIAKFVVRLDEKLGLMEASWQARDYDELAKLAHWLKGAAGTVGFDAFTEPAVEFEQQVKSHSEAEIGPSLAGLRAMAGRVVVSPGEASSGAPAARRELARTEPVKPEATAPVVSRLASGSPRVRATIGKFVARLGDKLAAMERSWQSRDYEELERLAYWLKGSGGTVGFDDFTEPATALEEHVRARQDAHIEATLSTLKGLADRIQEPGSTNRIEEPGTTDRIEEPGAIAPIRREEIRALPRAPVVASMPGGPIVSRLEAMNPRFRPTVRKFVGVLGGKLAAMEAAHEVSDYEELSRLAHWLKGAGGTVGFDVFTEPATNLELLVRERKASEIEGSLQELRDLAGRLVVGGED